MNCSVLSDGIHSAFTATATVRMNYVLGVVVFLRPRNHKVLSLDGINCVLHRQHFTFSVCNGLIGVL